MRVNALAFLLLTFLLVGPVWAQEGEEAEASDTPSSEAAASDAAAPDAAASDTEESSDAPDVSLGADTGSSGLLVGRTPAVLGHSGLFHMNTASSLPTGTFAIGLFGEFFAATDVVRDGDTNSRFGGRLSLSWAAHENVEVFASLAGHGNLNDYVDPELIQSQGDIRLGGKAFGPIQDSGFSLGGALTLLFLNGENAVGFDFASTSMDIRGLASYDLRQVADVPLQAHFNIGFFMDNSSELFEVPLQRIERFAHTISEFNQVRLGLGFEVPVDYVTPFLEWNLGIPVGGDEAALECDTSIVPCPSDAGFASYPNAITLGVKGSPIAQLALNLGVDIGLSSEEATGLPATAPYDIHFGLTYNIDPDATASATPDEDVPPPGGWILGEVVNDVTGLPVAGAVVNYTNQSNSGQVTDAASGRFRSYEFPPGTELTVRIEHPGYEVRQFSRVVPEGEDAIRIRMNPIASNAQIVGSITSANGNALQATVYVAGEMLEEPMTLEVDAGAFALELEPGAYTVVVMSSGYATARDPVEMEVGTFEWTYALETLPEGQFAVLRSDRISLSGSRVTFNDDGDQLENASLDLLDQVVDLLAAHPDLRIQVVAHSDDRGSVEGTEVQAEVVRAYLVDSGVADDRIETYGAADEDPLFPNINDRNRRRNRRVEFLFLE